jgi:hypothetical protein
MTFLPFVFTFLLLLSLIGSFLFSSVIAAAREHEVIISQHRVYLTLISNQNKRIFQSKKVRREQKPKGSTNNKNNALRKSKKEPRSNCDGCQQSKLNLFNLLHENNPQLKHTLEQTAIRLMEILYGSCNFYIPYAAHTIVQQMIDQKIESLEALVLDDNKLNQVYYKMLKGTSTGYPPLAEYFCLSKEGQKPIHFRYATKPVLRAALGEGFANIVLDLEKKEWQKNKATTVLSKEELIATIKTHRSSLIPESLIYNIFDFRNIKKGLPETYESQRIKAFKRPIFSTFAEG